MNELIREIEDDIRREKFDRLWKRFGRIMVGISVLVVLVTIAVVIMQNQKESRQMEKTSHYIRGIDRMNVEDFKGAIAIFDELSVDSSSPYYGLAMLQKAKAQEALGDKKAAGATYAQLAAARSTFAGLAGLLAPAETGGDVVPDKASPFYYTQREWNGWQLLEKGKKKEAVDAFMALRDDMQAPMTLRARANEAVQYLAPEKLAQDTATKPAVDAPKAGGTANE